MFDLRRLSYMLDWNKDIYKKGIELFRTGQIKDVRLTAKQDNTVIEAKVMDGIAYTTNVTLGKRNQYQSSSCSCMENYHYGNICPHIGALYEYVSNDKNLIKEFKYIAADEVLDEYFSKRETSKKQVNMAYTFEYLPMYGSSILGNLWLKIGIDRLYVVKNIKGLLDAIEGENLIIDYGKKFSFNPRLYEFKGEDRRVIEFLIDLYSSEKALKSEGYYNSGSFFTGKSIKMNEKMFIKFCRLIGNKKLDLKLNYDTVVSNVTIDFDNYPFVIDIDNKRDNVIARLEHVGDFQLLDENSSIIYSSNKIYILDTNKYLYNFIKIASKRNVNIMEFKGENKNKFLSILPEIIDDNAVKISGEIRKNYVIEEFKGSIYLDKFKRGISLEVEFKYGSNKINPMNKEKINPFIIRKYGAENNIMTLIEDAGFKIKNDTVYLDDEDKIYIFFRDIVPALSKLCSIYYTDDIKDIYQGRIKKARSYISTSISSGIIDIDIEIDGIDKKELKDILRSIKEKKNYHRLKNGNFISLEGESAEKIYSLVEKINKDDIKENKIKLNNYRAISLLQSIDDKSIIENRGEIDDLINKIKSSNYQDIEIPDNLSNILRDYQVTGYKWLKVLMNSGLGGILADDMGLGKTLQAIALICSEKYKGIPSLVIAPSSLIYNWENEIKIFAKELKVLVVSGDKKIREEMLSNADNYDLVITSYPLIRRDIDIYENISFNICILDEAQHIKNPGSQNSDCVKRIKSGNRFVLTGTPMENSLIELWSIFDFIMPDYLESRNKFVEKYQKPILKDDENVLKELRRCISPFILRRTKKEVLKELPEKIETKLICELTHEQKLLYAAYIESAREKIHMEIENKGFEKSRIEILSALTRLRQICCHPSVFVENYDGTSGKMELLEELIDELIEGKHRILLFSQFTSLLTIIRDRLDEKNIGYMYLDGATPVFERMKLVEGFNSGIGSVFLISLKAGGTGLNLTSADTVIHFDPWWNPAVEEQAADRAYRIGQENRVQVFKLITKNTIEEKIFELQCKKRELINSVIKEGETFINKLSNEEIMELFNS